MYVVVNLCTSIRGKNYFLSRNTWGVNEPSSPSRCDIPCSKQTGEPIQVCQPVHGGSQDLLCQESKRELCLCCCTRTGCNMHSFIIVSAFSWWSPMWRNQSPFPVHPVFNL